MLECWTAQRNRSPLRTPAYQATLFLWIALTSCDAQTALVTPDSESEFVVLANTRSIPSIGDTIQLQAATHTPILKVVPNAAVQWHSSDSTVITVDSLGRAVSIGVGAAVITAAYLGRTATATLQSEPVLMELSIDLPDAPIYVGSVTQLSAEAIDTHGRPIPDLSIGWRSKTPDLATVSVGGTIEALASGTAELGVRAGAKERFVTLEIEAVRVRSATVSPQAVSVEEGTTQAFTLRVEDLSGEEVSDPTVDWAISDESLAEVSNGEVVAIRAGQVNLVASSGGMSDTATVSLTPTQVATVSLDPASQTLEVNESTALTPAFQDAVGTLLDGRVPRWSTSDSNVAMVADGVVMAVSPGKAIITASVGERTGQASIRVVDSGAGGGGGPDDPGGGIDPLRAFPTAEGHGALALTSCNRSNVRLFTVTNTGDAGTGTLRQAMADAEAAPDGDLKVITFRVSGYIDLSRRIDFGGNCLYLAGQTAPGGGITLRSGGQLLFQHGAHDVVVRYIRFRSGQGAVNLQVAAGENYVLDHLSLSWAAEKMIMVSRVDIAWSRPVSKVTVQNSLLGEPLSAKPVSMNISGTPKGWEGSTPPGWSEVSDITVHHNLFANSHHRNPQSGAQGIQVINNVMYNYSMDAGAAVHGARLDWIANLAKPGPMTEPWRFELTYRCDDPRIPGLEPSLYASGNVGPHNPTGHADNWIGPGRMIACYNNSQNPEVPSWVRRSTPLPEPSIPVTVQSPFEAFEDVLADAGANRRLTCTGEWENMRDAADEGMVADTRSGTGPAGPLTSVAAYGGYPNLAQGTPCADRDSDGMPDDFEELWGLDGDSRGDASADGDGDGYTNLEEYLNGTRPN